MYQVDDAEWTELTANIEERVLVAVVRGKAGTGKLEKLNSDRLVDEGESLNSPTEGKNLYYW